MLNVENAVVSRTSTGVTVDDPESPWIVRVTAAADPTRITSLTVKAKPGGTSSITAGGLARLPTPQLLHVAALHMLDSSHPGEAYYRMIATPKPDGARSWPPEHWDNVRTVAAWADNTDRPGGARQAIADLWAVTTEPTTRRWLKQAEYTTKE